MPSTTAAADELIDALTALDATVTEYLSIDRPSDPNDPNAWSAWAEASGVIVDAMHSAYTEWAATVDSAITQLSPLELGGTASQWRSFVDAMSAWIDAQAEQVEMSTRCLALLPDGDESGACFAAGVQADGPRWQATADRLNEAKQFLAAT